MIVLCDTCAISFTALDVSLTNNILKGDAYVPLHYVYPYDWLMHKGQGFYIQARAGIHPVSYPVLTGGFFTGCDGNEVPGRETDDPPPSGAERIHGAVSLLLHTLQ
jgi:hypothetical protein